MNQLHYAAQCEAIEAVYGVTIRYESAMYLKRRVLTEVECVEHMKNCVGVEALMKTERLKSSNGNDA